MFCLIYYMYGVCTNIAFVKDISNRHSNKRTVQLKLNINHKIRIFNASWMWKCWVKCNKFSLQRTLLVAYLGLYTSFPWSPHDLHL